ncbi:hypothetical protein CW368_04795 [Actinomycetales bacterium SN12]|nr:hypothetical protein CW368_04795 [Actinomycetales bacterium SN12]
MAFEPPEVGRLEEEDELPFEPGLCDFPPMVVVPSLFFDQRSKMPVGGSSPFSSATAGAVTESIAPRVTTSTRAFR